VCEFEFNQIVLTGLNVLDMLDKDIMVEVVNVDGEYISIKLLKE
jgi:hypothetical protein